MRQINVIENGVGFNALGMGLASEGRRYIVTSSRIGWAHTQNDLWRMVSFTQHI